VDDATLRASERLEQLSERIKIAGAIIAGLLIGLLAWLVVMYFLFRPVLNGPLLD
jgi:hypothetical protein